MQKEIWASIPNFSRYLVSNHGRVVNQQTGRVMSPIKTIANRYVVGLTSDMGFTRQLFLHTMVWETFVQEPIDGGSIEYLDDDPQNTAVWNLVLVCARPRARVRVRNVATGEVFDSMAQAARSVHAVPGRLIYAVRLNKEINGHRFEIVE